MIVVLDIGKTMAKLSLWDEAGGLVARETRANARLVSAAGYPALDAAGIEAWLGETLSKFARLGDVGAIIPVGHGAAAAVIRDGALAAAPMDYEYEPPAEWRADYVRQRDGFEETGSPPMGLSLNLGLQLHCLERLQPGLLDAGAQILPWAQYWAWVLSGVAAGEVTSWGCHTDLWSPARRGPSEMCVRRGWASRFAPLRGAQEQLAPLSPTWVARTGLAPDVAVHVGLHDSNASLHAARAWPQIAAHDATVISTGTWFVSMRSLGPRSEIDLAKLPNGRGVLVNVDASGRPVPTAGFMGGREIELSGAPALDAPEHQQDLLAALATVVRAEAMLAPTAVPGAGPYPNAPGGWRNRPDDAMQLGAAVALYAALVTDTALDLIGARETLLVDGRFARAEAYVRALATLRPQARVYLGGAESDVSFGALRLIRPELGGAAPLSEAAPLPLDLTAYRARWRRLAEAR